MIQIYNKVVQKTNKMHNIIVIILKYFYMSVKERIIKFIEFKEMTKRGFCESIGVGQTFISSMKKSTSEENMHKIIERYPELNYDWLFMGKGEMINTSTDKDENDNVKRLTTDLGTGVPYYDIDITATLTESFSDIRETPEFYVDFKPFNDCSAYLPVFGDSMHPLINSGEIVALKKVEFPEYIQYGEPHLVITNADTNNMRTLKIVRKHKDEAMIILKPINPEFDELAIPRKSILSLYIVKGKITRKQL